MTTYDYTQETTPYEIELPFSAVEDLTQPMDITQDAYHWLRVLDFAVDPFDGWFYLTDCGLDSQDFWKEDIDGDETILDEEKINVYVLWIACGDIKERGSCCFDPIGW